MSELTVKQLEQALQRLLNGTPKRTKRDGKINISRINDEAGLSKSNINYYPDFIKYAKDKINDHHDKIAEEKIKEGVQQGKTELDKLREKLKHEKRLKKKYCDERDEQKLLNDHVVAQNVSLSFRLMELEAELQSLTRHKVAAFS